MDHNDPSHEKSPIFLCQAWPRVHNIWMSKYLNLSVVELLCLYTGTCIRVQTSLESPDQTLLGQVLYDSMSHLSFRFCGGFCFNTPVLVRIG